MAYKWSLSRVRKTRMCAYLIMKKKKEEDLTLVSDTSDTGGIVGWYPPEWVTPIEKSN